MSSQPRLNLLAHAEVSNLVQAERLTQAERLVVVSMGMNVLLIYYLWRSPRVADTFADFPMPNSVPDTNTAR